VVASSPAPAGVRLSGEPAIDPAGLTLGVAAAGAPARQRPLAGQLIGVVGLVKFRNHITFVNVVFSALLFANHIDGALWIRLALLYLSFNVLLYSGLYTMNDIADRQADAAHPGKCLRPIPSGRIGIGVAMVATVAFVTLGIFTGAQLFGASVLTCYGAVIVINVVYSCGGRDVAYVDVVLNGLPHVVRFLMGAALVGRQPPLTHLISLLALAIVMSCLRRRIERDTPGWEARRALHAWSDKGLERVMAFSTATMLSIAVWQGPVAPGFHATVLGCFAVLVGGAHASPRLRRSLRWFWVR
jgi:4-hydroxybenzoate polyprenyltransferase